MKIALRSRPLFFAFVITIFFAGGAGWSRPGNPAGAPPSPRQSQAEPPKSPVPAAALIEPEDLARILGSREAEKPLIFQVGFHLLYKQAHIPGAEYTGPASKDDGIQQLRKRVASLARTKFIVLYCGCCPWNRCPNVKPAYDALRDLGFKQVKVLRVEENFGTNWLAKGYPTAKGE